MIIGSRTSKVCKGSKANIISACDSDIVTRIEHIEIPSLNDNNNIIIINPPH